MAPSVGDGRTPLAAWSRLSIIAMILFVPVSLYGTSFLARRVDMAGIVMSTIALLAAGVVTTRRRWAPALVALVSLLFLVASAPLMVRALGRPHETPEFLYWSALSVVLAVGAISGIAATRQNRRRTAAADATPMPLPMVVAGLAGVLVGQLVITVIARDAGALLVASQSLAGLPVLTSPDFRFDRTELRAKAGEAVALRLENTDDVPHSFDIDEFDVHLPMVRGTPTLALFTPSQPGTYTFYCRIPGHREAGMLGTLTVDP